MSSEIEATAVPQKPPMRTEPNSDRTLSLVLKLPMPPAKRLRLLLWPTAMPSVAASEMLAVTPMVPLLPR